MYADSYFKDKYIHSYIIISYYPQLLSCMPASKTFPICAPNDIRQNSEIMENYIIIDETNMRTYLHVTIYEHAFLFVKDKNPVRCASVLRLCDLKYFSNFKMKKILDLFSD